MKLQVALSLGLLGCVLVSANYPNPITDDELVSVVTSSIDPFFYKAGSEVGTDKVWLLKLSDANVPRPLDDLTEIRERIRRYITAVCLQVWDHRYDYVYSRLLAPIRREPIRLLEIGLGECPFSLV